MSKLIVAFRNFGMGPKSTLPLFCKIEKTHKISILQEKQDDDSFLHVTDALTGRISLTYLGYS
jgi:hypothetical protein